MSIYRVIIKRTDQYMVEAKSPEEAVIKAQHNPSSWYASETTHVEARESK